jgi:hypothetical protein
VRNLDPYIQRRIGVIGIVPHAAMYFAASAMNFTTRFLPDVARRRDAVCDTLAFQCCGRRTDRHRRMAWRLRLHRQELFLMPVGFG